MTTLSLFSQKQPKVGLVLSGGGAKGFAHVGVLKELEKTGLQIDYIGGTSMGAIVGALYASGYSPKQIEGVIKEADFMNLLQDEVVRESKPFRVKQNSEKYAVTLPIRQGGIGLPLGLSRGQNVLNFLTELLAPVDDIVDFSKLPIPFFCVGTNIETGKEVVLEKGSLPLALRASAAFPSLLNPVDIDGQLIVDGGVVNNFPVDLMRTKDVDIVIGVNVQGHLLEREELSSVASLLLQIVNFQMYKKTDEQMRLLDVILKPNILEYNIISFDRNKEIIKEGVRVAKSNRIVFDSIAKLQTIKRQRPQINLKKTKFLVDRIIIRGNKNYTDNYILGKLKLEEGDSTSYRDVSEKISSLSATNNFERIDYHFEKSFSGKKLELKVKEEKIKSYVRFGLHYDLLYRTGVLLNYDHRKLFRQNDEFNLDLVIGDRIRYKLDYFIDNGIIPSYGFSSSYNSFRNAMVFDKDFTNKYNVRYLDFTNTFYVQTTINKKIAFGIGIENKRIKVSSDTFLTNGEDAFFDNSNYIDAYSFLKLDAYNKSVYPTDGYFANIGFKWFIWSDRNNRIDEFIQQSEEFKQFSQISGTIGLAKSFFDEKFTFQYTGEGGFTLGNESSEVFDYRLGGYNKNYINNFVSFYGYDMSELVNQTFVKSEFNFRYNFFKKHHFNFIANYASVEHDVFKHKKII
ncbi:MAG TPA: patatin, partial [Tenacibaculum sp.]|nr:patatin [Tenacibaculum sp.]